MKHIKEAIIVTNNSCNLRCTYCKVDELSREIMTTQNIKDLIDELKNQNINYLHYIGGEPLLRKDAPEIMEYSKKQGIKNILHSNGSVIKLFNKALPFINVYHTCLNGNKKSHEITRGENTFDNVMQCIDIALQNNVDVIVDMIITTQNCNQDDVDFVMNLANQKGFKINFQKVFAHNLVGVNQSDIITIKAPNPKVFKLFQYIEEKYDETILLNTLEFIKIHQKQNQVVVDKCTNDIIVIGHDGNVHYCYGYMNEKNNGLEIGWKNALNFIKNKQADCVTCPYTNHAESNLFNKEN
jgi:molybdenum cofactor biosynthesis enzyme MoaA